MNLNPADQDRLAKLAARFAGQARFCADSSPLYHRLFALLGARLESDADFVRRLLAASAGRASFDVPLLLLAGLHFQVLRRHPAARELAAFYPDAGGALSPEHDELVFVLSRTCDRLWDELADFIAARPVQTNEPGRGLCWLLPLAYTGWTAVHLAEMGASAGLNLAASPRAFSLRPEGGGAPYFGAAGPDAEDACVVHCDGPFVAPPASAEPCRVLSRDGCDLAPIAADDPEARDYLAAFVWADQPERLRRLRNALDELARINAGDAPVRLAPCRLPDELPAWLDTLPRDDAPLVLFNTYLGIYLPDKGGELAPLVDAWARKRPSPTLWLQWEHPRTRPEDGPAPQPPAFGWLAWTADLWRDGTHRRFHLAWVHPHGGRVQWLPGLAEWRENSRPTL